MNCKRILALLVTMGILLLGTSQVTGQQDEPKSPQGTYGYAFTYQGQLKDAAGPVNGQCDLRFKLWDAASGGSQVGWTWLLEGVEIVDGLFTARLDFGGMDIHNGSARWLEVDVRCPAGSGGYVTLDPRQELTGAPAALSLALPFLADANLGGPLLWIENNGVGEAAGFESVGGIALWVEAPASEGVHVATAGQDGVHVVNADGHGLAVDSAGSNGVYVASAGADGVKVSMAGSPSMAAGDAKANGFEIGGAQGDGLFVGRADVNGIRVGSAGNDGVYVGMVGNPSNVVISPDNNGFEVAGAEGNGLYVGQADSSGVAVNTTGGHGIDVLTAHGHGLAIGQVDYDGVHIGTAGEDGYSVNMAVDNGFEVGGTAGLHGLYVNFAGDTGVFIHQSGWNGMVIEYAGGDGVRVTNTVYNALYGDTANAQGEWGLYTPDKVHAQNVTLQTLTLIAQVTGSDALSPGDVVAAAGVAGPLPGTGAPLPLVQLTGPEATGVVGVVEGRLALTLVPQPEGEEAQPRLELRSAEGPARSGDYVALTVLGVARVKVDAGQGSIQPGTRLTSGTGGRVRALKTVVVEGVTLTESAPVLGIALTAPDEDGLVWVLVNPQ
jgi:hypothetical protein